ncbi:hypothetical protein QEN19_000262 [Hanseniaspora menglaensis]
MSLRNNQIQILEFLKNFKDYANIGKLITSEEIWFDRLEQELSLLDEDNEIKYDINGLEELAVNTYPQVFTCSKYTYQYLDALYVVLIEGILRDYLLQTVNVDFLDIQDKINDYRTKVMALDRPLNSREIERIDDWKKLLIAKKIDFHIIEKLIETFETQFTKIIQHNQENDVLLTRLVQLRKKRLKMISKIEIELGSEKYSQKTE